MSGDLRVYDRAGDLGVYAEDEEEAAAVAVGWPGGDFSVYDPESALVVEKGRDGYLMALVLSDSFPCLLGGRCSSAAAAALDVIRLDEAGGGIAFCGVATLDEDADGCCVCVPAAATMGLLVAPGRTARDWDGCR